jgi:hypothetical protein
VHQLAQVHAGLACRLPPLQRLRVNRGRPPLVQPRMACRTASSMSCMAVWIAGYVGTQECGELWSRCRAGNSV